MLNRSYSLEEKFNVLKSEGILRGYTDGQVGFGNTATRAETAVLASTISGYSASNLPKPKSSSFRDVLRGSWYFGWGESAYEAGAMNGRGFGNFHPNANITIEEFVVVMARALGLLSVDNAKVTGASDWAQGWIQAAIDKGLIQERTDYTAHITREDMVQFLYEAYSLNLLKRVSFNNFETSLPQ